MNHFPSINAISASICLLGCGLALPVFSQQPEKGKPDAAHISKTKADWWSQRHALLKQTLAETPCQLLFIGDSITHRWETDGKKIWSRVHRLPPATEIILLHIFPRGKTAEDPLRIQNEMINRELDKTKMPRVHVVNINSAFLDKDGTFLPGITGDLVHLTEKGYRLWADALLPEIKKYMK